MTNWWRRNYPLVIILIIALLLRLPQLTGSFWLDEAAQALESIRPLSQQILITDDFQPPLLHFITHFAAQLSWSEWWLRLWGALIPGLLTVWGTYLLGTKLASKKVGLTAAMLLATSSFHLFYSQELRPYSLSALFTVFSWFFLLEAIGVGQDSYQLKPKNPVNKFFHLFPISRDFFLFLLLSILGIYTSYLYPFVLISQIIYLLVRRRSVLAGWAILIPTVAFLPWLSSFLDQLAAGQLLRTTFPDWENIVSYDLWRSLSLTFGKFFFGVLDLELSVAFLVLVGLLIVLLLAVIMNKKTRFWRQNKDRLLLWLYLMVIPFVLAAVVSIFVPIIQPKRIIYLLPFAYLLLSFLIFGTRADWRFLKMSNWLLLIYVLAINLFGTFAYYQSPLYQRENWRQAIQTLHQEYSSRNTLALFAYEQPFSPWRWYEMRYTDPFPTLTTGSYNTSEVNNLGLMLQPISNYDYVITFDYLRSLTDQENLVPKTLELLGFEEIRQLDYPNLGFIRIYHQLPTDETYYHWSQ